jgi:hypothetical protein
MDVVYFKGQTEPKKITKGEVRILLEHWCQSKEIRKEDILFVQENLNKGNPNILYEDGNTL